MSYYAETRAKPGNPPTCHAFLSLWHCLGLFQALPRWCVPVFWSSRVSDVFAFVSAVAAFLLIIVDFVIFIFILFPPYCLFDVIKPEVYLYYNIPLFLIVTPTLFVSCRVFNSNLSALYRDDMQLKRERRRWFWRE